MSGVNKSIEDLHKLADKNLQLVTSESSGSISLSCRTRGENLVEPIDISGGVASETVYWLSCTDKFVVGMVGKILEVSAGLQHRTFKDGGKRVKMLEITEENRSPPLKLSYVQKSGEECWSKCSKSALKMRLNYSEKLVCQCELYVWDPSLWLDYKYREAEVKLGYKGLSQLFIVQLEGKLDHLSFSEACHEDSNLGSHYGAEKMGLGTPLEPSNQQQPQNQHHVQCVQGQIYHQCQVHQQQWSRRAHLLEKASHNNEIQKMTRQPIIACSNRIGQGWKVSLRLPPPDTRTEITAVTIIVEEASPRDVCNRRAPIRKGWESKRHHGDGLTFVSVYRRNTSRQEFGETCCFVWVRNYVVNSVEWVRGKEAVVLYDEMLDAASLNVNKIEIEDLKDVSLFKLMEKWQDNDKNISTPLTRQYELLVNNHDMTRWELFFSVSLASRLLQYMLRQEEELSREMEFCLKSLEGDDANLEEAMEWKEVLDVHTGKCDLSEETVVFSLNYSSLT
ncbi:hypothetical protein Bca52824_074812 [Brassica carinata]|uniref:Uncharacterized protein n=1 Tax=Brassica carinata TaxID=52824 RepID=A0A8X7PR88_BRACI|nr:hypothetical protein Bca52824_074812 [Brassica carinata]